MRQIRKRKQAMFGLAAALISAAASAAATGISAGANAKRARDAKREADYQNAIAQANSLTDTINSGYDLQSQIDRQQNVVAKRGVRRTMRQATNPSTGGSKQLNMGNGVVADNKGHWLEIQPNVYWNPDGPLHGSEGGINIDQMTKGGKKPLAEMQGGDRNHVGEILDTSDPSQITVISDRVINPETGRSFAEDVIMGKNATEAGDEQESLKKLPRRRNRVRQHAETGWRDWLRNGWNDWANWASLSTAGDRAALGASIVGNLASAALNVATNRKFRAPERPLLYNRGALNTTYNIRPQLSNIEETRNATNAFVSRNSSSSASARDKIAESNLSSAIKANELWGQKSNTESQLVNDNIRWQDEARRANLEALNNYRNSLTDFYNQRRANQASYINQAIGGIGTAFNNFASNVDTRRQDQINAISQIAAGQPETVQYLFDTYPQLSGLIGLTPRRRGTKSVPMISTSSVAPQGTVTSLATTQIPMYDPFWEADNTPIQAPPIRYFSRDNSLEARLNRLLSRSNAKYGYRRSLKC